MGKTVLKGITWDHSRGYSPMVATAQRFCELYPDVEITWQKRTLQSFADESIAALAQRFDLLVIDHPWVGFAAAGKTLLPLNLYLNDNIIQELRKYNVGKSLESYYYDGVHWALPIDAAAPVASYRADLLNNSGLSLPKTYEDLLELAGKGVVAMPAIPIDSLMHFYMFCCSLGEDPFCSRNEVVRPELGKEALKLLKRLIDTLDKRCFEWNPFKVYERMSNTDEFIYCPFAYGYANYARDGYAKKKLCFTDLTMLKDGVRFKSTLGGTGIAISANTKAVEEAVKYVEYVASSECQQTLYFAAGGQPAHYTAWRSSDVNSWSGNFFVDTISTLTSAYLRPRYNGYLDFQDKGGDVVQTYLKYGGEERKVLEKLNELYLNTL